MERIESLQNAKIKNVSKLMSSSKSRRDCGLFVIEGLRLCCDIVRSDMKIEELYFTKDIYEKNKEDIDKLCSISSAVYEITNEISQKISDTKSSQGVFCVIKAIDKTSDNYKIYFKGKYILLENLQDPSNLGAIARTAEALKIDGIITYNCCDIYNPKVLRAAMGAMLRINITDIDNIEDFISTCKANKMKTYASTPSKDAKSILDVDMTDGVLCIIGNEAQGISESTMSCCDERIRIEMAGRAESLNASVAASIIMWEMVKA